MPGAHTALHLPCTRHSPSACAPWLLETVCADCQQTMRQCNSRLLRLIVVAIVRLLQPRVRVQNPLPSDGGLLETVAQETSGR